jgi:hypothetical protein
LEGASLEQGYCVIVAKVRQDRPYLCFADIWAKHAEKAIQAPKPSLICARIGAFQQFPQQRTLVRPRGCEDQALPDRSASIADGKHSANSI